MDLHLDTELLKHLKNTYRVDKVADIIRMMYRWGFCTFDELDKQLDRLTLKNFQNDRPDIIQEIISQD